MKTFTHFFMTAVLFTTLALAGSCRKDKESAAPPSPVLGTWKGSVTGKGDPIPIRFDILDNGTVIAQAQSAQFSGTWKLTANDFEAGFVVESIKATAKGTLSEGKNKITGTWLENNNGKITEQQLTLSKN
ncbi:hypothetical protein [Niabella drilacis]|uniref:Extracellular endo-alpha-(1->5)-L-arabinanase C-terminal domain-containing protein n=1 Tax=Niabella drilacis (strain DSM 25811 / CCM 8410 / CCUG 62505 / LMG 26954 / E90) TaxID=1285928 RepID=A0A1G6LCN9_NIADE|nr:hypothetical protein [Niabella drilacis]SDC40535.1 hypothetical protein SAMN04487894_102291 [Niabella drilacis]